MESSGEETPCLPEQVIMEEILTRLPVKSLLKFRCVSKPWCSLIGSKRFIKAHLKNSIKSSSFAVHHLILYEVFEKGIKQCSLSSLFDNPFTDPINCNADLGIDIKCEKVIPVGCCNGLICILLDWERFMLWNPTTKKFRNLPDLYNQIKVECGSMTTYGFGFDELSDDYKVFGIVYGLNGRGCIGMIYSLRSNLWKHIEKTDHISPLNDEGMGIHVSGKLHWCVCKRGIVSFDLNRHVCGVVELPSYTKGDLHGVGAIGECLSAHFFHPNGDLDVWVMKEYGVKESWDKVVTVSEYGTPEPCDPIIKVYNPKWDAFRHHIITGLDDQPSMLNPLGINIESLVSVAPDTNKRDDTIKCKL